MTESGSQHHQRELALIGLLVLAFGPALSGILRRTIELNGYYDHLALAAAVSAWFLVRGWHGPGKSSRWGWPPLLVGLWFNIVGRTEQVLLLQVLGMWFTLGGVVLLKGGFSLLWSLRFPLTFLLLALPLPRLMLDASTGSLRLFVTSGAVACLELMGVAAVHQGTSILMEGTRIEVDPTCSGLQGLLAFVLLSALIARPLRGFLAPTALLVSALPLAVLGNLIRVLSLTVLATKWPAVVQNGTIHAGVGVLTYGLAYFALGALREMVDEAAPPEEPAPSLQPPTTTTPGLVLGALGTGSLLALLAPVWFYPVPCGALAVPLKGGGWVGDGVPLPEAVQGSVYIRYSHSQYGGFVDFYAAYGSGTRLEYHPPAGCFSGSGFTRSPAPPIRELPAVTESERFTRGSEQYLSFVWCRREGRDVALPTPYDLRMDASLRRLILRSVDSEAVFRLVTPDDGQGATRVADLAREVKPWARTGVSSAQ